MRDVRYWEHEWTGGLRYGDNAWLALNVVGLRPVRLVASPRQLAIHTRDAWLPPVLLFPHAKVCRIRRAGFLFGGGVRIEHVVQNYPRYLLFRIGGRTRLLSELSAMGYPAA